MSAHDDHARPRTTAPSPRSAAIAKLNDALRQWSVGGRMMITAGVSGLSAAQRAWALDAVRCFDAFTADNDPYGEHDFGAVEHQGLRLFWKIDYYDRALEFASPDPADPAVTTRVLTIMLAEEY